MLACTILGSGALVALLLTTAARSDTRLGAPAYQAWVLTGLQVAALWAAGAGHLWGWPLGAAVQPAWIAYALVTGQVGFILGCVVSGAVQIANFLRQAGTSAGERRADAAGPSGEHGGAQPTQLRNGASSSTSSCPVSPRHDGELGPCHRRRPRGRDRRIGQVRRTRKRAGRIAESNPITRRLTGDLTYNHDPSLPF